MLRLNNRVRFIKGVIAGTLRVNNRKKADIEADLVAQGFDRMPNTKAKVCCLTHSFSWLDVAWQTLQAPLRNSRSTASPLHFSNSNNEGELVSSLRV